MRDFRFSTNVFGIDSRQRFVMTCRRAEELGYDVLFAADHLGTAAPFPLLVAAAAATSRMRLGTLVLNAEFWNPVLLAREIATTDLLIDGRLEVGLGAGHMKWEFDAAGIEWRPLRARARRLEELVVQVGRFLTMDFDQLPEGVSAPRPVQRVGFGGSGPPLVIGGTGDAVLEIAAAHADVVGVVGVFQVKGKPPGTFRLATAAEADERVGFARQRLGTRVARIEWHLLVQAVVVTDDRQGTGAELLERFGGTMSLDELLETPYVLTGTVEEMADQLRAHRQRYGYSHVTGHGPYMEMFAPVMSALRRASVGSHGPRRRPSGHPRAEPCRADHAQGGRQPADVAGDRRGARRRPPAGQQPGDRVQGASPAPRPEGVAVRIPRRVLRPLGAGGRPR
jgi:probable F420-dependent oxidoreductase